MANHFPRNLINRLLDRNVELENQLINWVGRCVEVVTRMETLHRRYERRIEKLNECFVLAIIVLVILIVIIMVYISVN